MCAKCEHAVSLAENSGREAMHAADEFEAFKALIDEGKGVEAAGSALVRFVGIDAYETAGAVVRRDLFDNEQSRFLSDPALLDRLATEKLETLASTMCEEGFWVAFSCVNTMALWCSAPYTGLCPSSPSLCHFLVGNTHPVQAHTTLDKASRCDRNANAIHFIDEVRCHTPNPR